MNFYRKALASHNIHQIDESFITLSSDVSVLERERSSYDP